MSCKWVAGSHHYCLPGCALAGNLNWQWTQDSNPGTPTGDAGISIDVIITLPNAYSHGPCFWRNNGLVGSKKKKWDKFRTQRGLFNPTWRGRVWKYFLRVNYQRMNWMKEYRHIMLRGNTFCKYLAIKRGWETLSKCSCWSSPRSIILEILTVFDSQNVKLKL